MIVRTVSVFILAFIFILLVPQINLYATEDKNLEYTPQDKFARGLFNLVTGFFEIPKAIYEVSIKENPLAGLLYGIPLGLGKSIIRLSIGFVEVATAPMPPYEPILKPEYLIINPNTEK